MIARNFVLFRFLPGVLMLGLLADTAVAAKGTTTPGTYRNWNGDLDEVTIIQPFRLDTYNDIAVESFDVAGVTLPNPNENTYEAVRSALGSIKPAFIQGLLQNLRQKPGAANMPRGKGETLVIRARLLKVDPGSQAARYFIRFGAGAVKIEMLGEVIDARSRKTLLRFRQERRSGFGAFGGAYSELFARTARQIGGDVAALLNAF
ncbi:MAG TPA: DUF4410 domain-containing protein [Chthoniobacterales bacterium]|nr:DUF4410 domain-containing protein [Chthoniobacterales bacterium]